MKFYKNFKTSAKDLRECKCNKSKNLNKRQKNTNNHKPKLIKMMMRVKN